MEAIGNRYLVQVKAPQKQEKIGDIILPQTVNEQSLVYYIGTVIGHGTSLDRTKIDDIVQINSKIIFDYKNKSDKIKLILSDKIYYLINPSDVLAIIEQD